MEQKGEDMERSVELRKIQRTGGSTYVVSLPKSWAKEAGLEQGSQVALVHQSDMSLMIVPRGDLRREKIDEASLEVSLDMEPDVAVREFVAHYLNGYDVIHVGFASQTTRQRAALKNIIKQKLMGVEIIEESSDNLTAQCLLGYKELPVNKAFSRMSVLASSMFKDSLQALEKWDHTLAHEVVERDDEIDRFYHFIVRQLKKAIYSRAMIDEIGLSSPSDCLGYRVMAKSVERIADHAARIAHTVLTLDSPVDKRYLRGISEMGSQSQEIYSVAIRALYKGDIKLTHKTIAKAKGMGGIEDKLIAQLLDLKVTNTLVIKLRVILESIRRIAEYGSDIAEIVLNLSIGRPQ